MLETPIAIIIIIMVKERPETRNNGKSKQNHNRIQIKLRSNLKVIIVCLFSLFCQLFETKLLLLLLEIVCIEQFWPREVCDQTSLVIVQVFLIQLI